MTALQGNLFRVSQIFFYFKFKFGDKPFLLYIGKFIINTYFQGTFGTFQKKFFRVCMF